MAGEPTYGGGRQHASETQDAFGLVSLADLLPSVLHACRHGRHGKDIALARARVFGRVLVEALGRDMTGEEPILQRELEALEWERQ